MTYYNRENMKFARGAKSMSMEQHMVQEEQHKLKDQGNGNGVKT